MVSIEVTGIIVLVSTLTVSIVKQWYSLKVLTEQQIENKLILTELGKRTSRIERFLMKTTDFAKGTDSGFF